VLTQIDTAEVASIHWCNRLIASSSTRILVKSGPSVLVSVTLPSEWKLNPLRPALLLDWPGFLEQDYSQRLAEERFLP